MCLSILNEDEGWRPSITVKAWPCRRMRASATPPRPTPMPASQELLDTPNPLSPAQADAYVMFQQRPDEYKRRVRAEAGKYPPPA